MRNKDIQKINKLLDRVSIRGALVLVTRRRNPDLTVEQIGNILDMSGANAMVHEKNLALALGKIYKSNKEDKRRKILTKRGEAIADIFEGALIPLLNLKLRKR